MSDKELEYTEIQQDHKRGPGWFLILSYVVIVAVCLLYYFRHIDWKSDYDKQQEKIELEITQE